MMRIQSIDGSSKATYKTRHAEPEGSSHLGDFQCLSVYHILINSQTLVESSAGSISFSKGASFNTCITCF